MESGFAFERYAIIKTGGKQYQAIEGKTLEIEKLALDVGAPVVFDEVLLRRIDKDHVEVGQPFLGVPVRATVVKHMRGPKLIAYKWKRRKKYRRKQGHRQEKTIVRIEAI